jgi:hypothetical protein
MAMHAVCSHLRLERCKFFGDVKSKALEQIPENMVELKPQPTGANLDRHVPVAEMIGRSSELGCAAAFDQKNTLGSGYDTDYPAVIGKQVVVLPQDATWLKQNSCFLSRF